MSNINEDMEVLAKNIAADRHAINVLIFLLIRKNVLGIKETVSYLHFAAGKAAFPEAQEVLMQLATSVASQDPEFTIQG